MPGVVLREATPENRRQVHDQRRQTHHRDLHRATGTVVSDDGRKGTYKREGNILKIFTLTMEGDIPEPPSAGFTAPYTSSIGATGR